jgi:hypothetical protein
MLNAMKLKKRLALLVVSAMLLSMLPINIVAVGQQSSDFQWQHQAQGCCGTGFAPLFTGMFGDATSPSAITVPSITFPVTPPQITFIPQQSPKLITVAPQNIKLDASQDLTVTSEREIASISMRAFYWCHEADDFVSIEIKSSEIDYTISNDEMQAVISAAWLSANLVEASWHIEVTFVSGFPRFEVAEFSAYTIPDTTGHSVLVSSFGSDNIGSVLRNAGIRHIQLNSGNGFLINDADFVANFDYIFINCGTDMDTAVLRNFVNNGGIAYISDLAFYVMDDAFPEMGFEVRNLSAQLSQVRVVSTGVPHLGHTLQRSLRDRLRIDGFQPNNFEARHALNGWALLTNWAQDAEVTVLVEGRIEQEIPSNVASGLWHPKVVGFSHGQGEVFYTSFHVSLGQTREVEIILEFLASAIRAGDVIDNNSNISAQNGFDSAAPLPGSIEPGETKLITNMNIEEGQDFILVNSQANNLYLTLVDPDGYIYTNKDTPSGSIITGISPAVGKVSVLGAFFNAFSQTDDMVVKSLGNNGIVVENAVEGEWGVFASLPNDGSAEPIEYVLGISLTRADDDGNDDGNDDDDNGDIVGNGGGRRGGGSSSSVSGNVSDAADVNSASADDDTELILPIAEVTVTSEVADNGSVNVNIVLAANGVAVTVQIPLEVGDANHYRFVAVDSSGNLVGGKYDPVTGLFSFETSSSGDYSIIYAESLNRLIVSIGSLVINDLAGNADTQTMDVSPVIESERVLLPVRFLAYALGANVSWNETTREVTLTRNGVPLTFGVDGVVSPALADLGMEVPAKIISGRTMVPLRFIGEYFGAIVNWNAAERTVEIIAK